MAKGSDNQKSAAHLALADIRVGKGRRRRKLTKTEIEQLVLMFALKSSVEDIDVLSLAPKGSILRHVAQHFQKTDISYAMPIMQLVMIAASFLTQKGASLKLKGLGRIRPTIWMIGLADSASSKTLAGDEINKALGGNCGLDLSVFPTGSTDAQWIEDLKDNNGSYWYQDEVGKFFNSVLTNRLYTRIKPWMLDAYSHKPVSNRLKSDAEKTSVEDPHFTFLGLSVYSTWQDDMDVTSMLDGFCQRFNFFVADKRQDTSMFDHFLYFAEDDTVKRREDLAGHWQALVNQPGATGDYEVNQDVVPYLDEWWSDLRHTIGQTPLPDSFTRRIGFSVLRYLIVLQFLLGKSRFPIDIETAHLATKFAEYHMASTLAVIRDYTPGKAEGVRKIADMRDRIIAEGGSATGRNISRRLSKTQRTEWPSQAINEILQVLKTVESRSGLFDVNAPAAEKTSALVNRRDGILERLALNERKRNERRLRDLRKDPEKTAVITPGRSPNDKSTATNVVSIRSSTVSARQAG